MDVHKLPHHEQKDLCKTRAPYRQGRKLTAVKVYTINDESVYLIITKVPDLKLETEVANLCQKFGIVEKIENLLNYPHDRFETTFLVKYRSVRSSRKAKKILDGKNFFGGVLHVCFAPELETISETRCKLRERKSAYLFFHRKNFQKSSGQVTKCKDFYRENINITDVNQLKIDSTHDLLPTLGKSFPVEPSKRIELCNPQNSSVTDNFEDKSSLVNNVVPEYNSLKLFNNKRLVSNNIKSYKRFKKSKNMVGNVSQPPINDLQKPVSEKKVKIK
ncbi:UNVERIFIED_CONTAM: hypothetical protein RMT77_005126 [Armadillidium vulgare]